MLQDSVEKSKLRDKEKYGLAIKRYCIKGLQKDVESRYTPVAFLKETFSRNGMERC